MKNEQKKDALASLPKISLFNKKRQEKESIIDDDVINNDILESSENNESLIKNESENNHDELQENLEVPIEVPIEEDVLDDSMFNDDIPIQKEDSQPKEYINTEEDYEDDLISSLISDANDELGISGDENDETDFIFEDIKVSTVSEDLNKENDYSEYENDLNEPDESQDEDLYNDTNDDNNYDEDNDYCNESEDEDINLNDEIYHSEENDDNDLTSNDRDENTPEEYSEEEYVEDFDGFYSNSEINNKRKPKSEAPLKIIIGVVAITVIVGGALFVRNLINKPKTETNTTDNNTNIEQAVDTNINTNQQDSTTEPPKETEVVAPDVDAEGQDLNKDNETEEESTADFVQTFTGYIVDINDTNIYVSDKLDSESITLLKNSFNKYMNGEGSASSNIVYVTERPTSSAEEEATNNGIIIIGTDTQSEETNEEEANENDTNEEKKLYHFGPSCEMHMVIDMVPVELSELGSEYEPCDSCMDGVDIDERKKEIKAEDYDYSVEPELASIVYKKFSTINATLPDWSTIGSQVTITYIQDSETMLNDIIEVTRAKSNITELDGNPVEGETSDTDDEDDYRLSNTNIFGADFDAIVATINDRKSREGEKRTGSVLDDELSLASEATKEELKQSIAIQPCDYVWIQIVWKKNADAKTVPEVDDVSIELQTPSGSLVNESNINEYGRKWINKKIVNYVLKNPKAGNWTVLFTKDIGTYLGDVTIQAAPMTGFLQIKKAAAKYTEGQLKCIWQTTGITDDNCIVKIFARNGNNDILLYSGNTIDDNVRTVDMVDIDTAKIAGNIYDIVIQVTDIDVSASLPKKITYKYITDEYVVSNVEIPATANKTTKSTNSTERQ